MNDKNMDKDNNESVNTDTGTLPNESTPVAKNNRRYTWVFITIVIVISIAIFFAWFVGREGTNGIKIRQEQLITDVRYTVIGNNLFPIVVVEVENTSTSTKNVSFEVNFYADGSLLGEDQASYVTLAPGDSAFLHAQSDKGYSAWTQHDYSYEITKWWVYNK